MVQLLFIGLLGTTELTLVVQNSSTSTNLPRRCDGVATGNMLLRDGGSACARREAPPHLHGARCQRMLCRSQVCSAPSVDVCSAHNCCAQWMCTGYGGEKVSTRLLHLTCSLAAAAYMSLPASQYSVLDARKIERVDDNTFSCYVGEVSGRCSHTPCQAGVCCFQGWPAVDFICLQLRMFKWSVEPVLLLSVTVLPGGCDIQLLSCKVGCNGDLEQRMAREAGEAALGPHAVDVCLGTGVTEPSCLLLLSLQLRGSPLVESINDKFSAQVASDGVATGNMLLRDGGSACARREAPPHLHGARCQRMLCRSQVCSAPSVDVCSAHNCCAQWMCTGYGGEKVSTRLLHLTCSLAAAAYMSLPASQYSVLDARKIERVDDNTFSCYVGEVSGRCSHTPCQAGVCCFQGWPAVDFICLQLRMFKWSVEPVLLLSVTVLPGGCDIQLLSCKVGCNGDLEQRMAREAGEAALGPHAVDVCLGTGVTEPSCLLLLSLQLRGSPLVESINDKFSAQVARCVVHPPLTFAPRTIAARNGCAQVMAEKKVTAPSRRKARLAASKFGTLEVIEAQKTLAAYMSLPASQYSVLDARKIERVDDNTFSCYVGELRMFKWSVEPVLLLSVTVLPGGCDIQLLSCKLRGSPLVESINDKFSAQMSNEVRWRDASSAAEPARKAIVSTTSLQVELEVPAWCGFLSTASIEAVGAGVLQNVRLCITAAAVQHLNRENLKMSQTQPVHRWKPIQDTVLEVMVPRFLSQLRTDYLLWASGDESRKPSERGAWPPNATRESVSYAGMDRKALLHEFDTIVAPQKAALSQRLPQLFQQYYEAAPVVSDYSAQAAPAQAVKRPFSGGLGGSEQKRPKATDESQRRIDQMYKDIVSLINRKLASRKADFLWFKEPVSPKVVPDYYNVIKNPMDFSTIRQKIQRQQYSTPLDVCEDVRLVWRNCATYNQVGTVPRQCGDRLSNIWEHAWAEARFEDQWNQIIHPRNTSAPVAQPVQAVSQKVGQLTSQLKSAMAAVPASANSDTHMTEVLKRRISIQLSELQGEQLAGVLDIVSSAVPASASHQEEIELDIDALPVDVLWKLKAYVDSLNSRGRGHSNVPGKRPLPADSGAGHAAYNAPSTSMRSQDEADTKGSSGAGSVNSDDDESPNEVKGSTMDDPRANGRGTFVHDTRGAADESKTAPPEQSAFLKDGTAARKAEVQLNTANWNTTAMQQPGGDDVAEPEEEDKMWEAFQTMEERKKKQAEEQQKLKEQQAEELRKQRAAAEAEVARRKAEAEDEARRLKEEEERAAEEQQRARMEQCDKEVDEIKVGLLGLLAALLAAAWWRLGACGMSCH
ncbi:hypothetical protein QJQ45_019284 [Haematococcus lacustris]|nr:hypothetical protein QJQ45_019284 [Haematococcus lacustris]